MEIAITTEYIELNKLLKIANLVPSGGIAGLIIKNEEVFVDGEVETRKKCKIRPGQTVVFDDEELLVVKEVE